MWTGRLWCVTGHGLSNQGGEGASLTPRTRGRLPAGRKKENTNEKEAGVRVLYPLGEAHYVSLATKPSGKSPQHATKDAPQGS